MQFGRYRIVEKLGAGGMGVVYRGVALGVDGFEKPVVIKRLQQRMIGRADVMARFVNEAKILMTMSHSNVVQVLDLGRVDDEYFMVLEQVEGRDLQRVLARCRELDQWPDQGLSLLIVGQVLRGLDYAHRRTDSEGRSRGIVHRDIKPANVLCSFEGDVKLTDFGVAGLAGSGLTGTGDILGTVRYMSPEQANASPVDQRSDIFAVGAILYHLLCGARPFEEERPDDLLQAVRHARIRPPWTLGVELSPALEQVLTTALARGPDDRFPSAAAMLAALEQCQQGGTPAATASQLSRLLQRLFADEPEPLPQRGDPLVGTEINTGFGGSAVGGTEVHWPPAAEATGATGPTVTAATSAPVAVTATASSGLVVPKSRVLVWAAGLLLICAAAIGVVLWTGIGDERSSVVVAAIDAGIAARPRVAQIRDAGTAVAAARPLELADATAAAVTLPDAAATAVTLPDGRPRRVARGGTRRRPRERARRARRRRAQPKVAFGSLVVATRPAYAEVYLGDRRLGTTPCRLRLPAGRHRLRLVNRKLGLAVERTVTVAQQTEQRLVLDRFGR